MLHNRDSIVAQTFPGGKGTATQPQPRTTAHAAERRQSQLRIVFG